MENRSTEDTNTSAFISEYPLTRGQAALWFHHQITPQSVAYNLAVVVAIPGDTDLRALHRAFRKLAERHSMLRTLFAMQQGEPVQRVRPFLEVAFECEDASGWSAEQLDDHLAKAVYRPFDLERGPTWRVNVYQRATTSIETIPDQDSREHLVLLTLHHMIGDLWSIAIILSEVVALYKEETTGVPATLKPFRESYVDHVNKERTRLAGSQAEISWNYWRSHLSGELSPLNLPADRPRPAFATGRGAVQTILVDQQLTHGLCLLAEKEQVPLYAVLLTAFQALLHRFTGQTDILVGFPKSGRSPATVRVVGYFVNQMVVQADFTEDPRFIDLLKRVQKSIEEGTRHDWYPFSTLVQRLQPARDLNHSPLIQTVFSWQQAPRLISRGNAGAFVLGQANQTIDLDGFVIRSVHLPHRVAPFDLMMLAAETPDGLTVTIEYATELFDEVTTLRMAGCYRTLLESITAAPQQQVSNLAILPETERAQLVEDWNVTVADYPETCLHQRFEQQVEDTPEGIAVVSGDEQLTYRQLNQRANQLAHFLQEQGVGPDRLVGVFLDPSVQMVVALLGILKAGGAYLPLDPGYPQERLAYMLADARPALLITCQKLHQQLPDFLGPLVSLDENENSLRSQSHTNPVSTTSPDHLAYVMYTSGSTGQPKGAALAHRGVMSLLADFQRRQPIQPGNACSWWTSPSFDVSVYEIFSPLLAGGSLQVIPAELRLNPPVILDWLYVQRICSAYLPPFLLADLAAWVENHPGVSQLRRLLVGVEPIQDALLAGLCTYIPGLCIINGYGPTETTICSTLYGIDPAHPHSGNAPIGKPAANTQVYLLDPALKPAPIGGVGELFIGGVGLARGYYNHPELTAQRFIPSPFRLGERLYRTGDLARYLSDGNLIYMGRMDTQVKLHGVRIELGEIEAALTEHPQVKQVVVLLQELSSGGKYLVAYVVPTQTPPPASEALRQFLNQRLPHALVPAVFVTMDAFPLTPTGKFDRKAFPLPPNLSSKLGTNDRVPRTASEQRLAAIWQQVLRLESIGIDDNFFEIGGDSILSLQIVAQAVEAGIPIKPQSIFQAPTIASLAALVDIAAPTQKRWEPENFEGVIPLTPIQRWFFEQNFPDPQHWNQSLMLTVSQPLDLVDLRSAVAELLMHHDALRLRFIEGSTGWQQYYADTDEQAPLQVIDLSNLAEAVQTEAIAKQIATQQSSLNLSTGPLIRVIYFDLGTDRPARLLMVAHHLVVDGISWRILLEDLQTAYRQHECGLPIQLPLKTSAFQTWARLLADLARSSDLEQEAGFWLRTAETIFPALPVDKGAFNLSNDDRKTEGTAQQVSVSLSLEETQALLREVPGAYGTETLDILLTALARALQRWVGTESLLIDLEAHGREDIFNDIDLTRTVGWFTALYPVHLDLPKDAGPGQAIKGIKEQLRCIPQHGLGYGLLRYFGPDSAIRDRLQMAPPASISFNYLGQLPQSSTDGLFSAGPPELVGFQRSPNAHRIHPIEINAAISQGKLHIDWIYSAQVHARPTIELVADYLIDELHHLIAHCLSPEAIGYTPSDFPAAGLSQAELDTILRLTTFSTRSISKRNLEAVYPLSPMQQGMVFHTLYAPQSGVYFVQTTFTIQGPLDGFIFEKAWQRGLARHSILRTSFVWQGLDRMLQVVHKDLKVPVEVLDWRDIPPAEQQDQLDSLLISERSRGFDLSVPPLLRLTICQTAADMHTVLMNYHHALLDGWSLPLLFEEVFAFYEALHHHQDLALPPPQPYCDYILWLHTRDMVAAEAFWRKELEGMVPGTWPSIQPSSSPPHGASRPAEFETYLSTHTTASLQAFARQHHLTISTLVQGAWAIILSRCLQHEDILFGITVAGRPATLPGVMKMVGLFINTLPLRVHFDPQSRLLEWLLKIQAKALEIQQFDDSPLSQIQMWSGVSRRSSLFDSILVVENYPINTNLSRQVSSLQIGNVRSHEQTTYPLTIAVTPGAQLAIKILYDLNRFEPAVIHQLLNDLCRVFESMITDPNQLLSTLSFGIQSNQAQLMEGGIAKNDPTPASTSFPTQHEQLLDRVSEQETGNQVDGQVPPGSPLEKHLSQLWGKLLKVDQPGIHDNFFELGGDSLVGAICIYQLQEALQEPISLNAIFEAPTVFELARYLEKNHPAGVAHLLGIPAPFSVIKEAVTNPLALVPIQPNGSKPPLFCIHPAGGVVFPYYTLAHFLGKDQPLYGIQDPSLYDTQSNPISIEAMATDYLEVIKNTQPKGPYQLLGWSVGGMVAYEMAQQLFRQGQSVALLIMLDTSAPPLRIPVTPPRRSFKDLLQRSVLWFRTIPNNVKGIALAARPVLTYIRSGLFLVAASVKKNRTTAMGKPTILDLLGWSGFDTWRIRLLSEAEVARTVPQDASLLLYEMPAVRRILEMVWKHRKIARLYTAEQYLGPITSFRAVHAKQNDNGAEDPTMGWGTLAENGMEVHTIQTNHVALMVKPYVEILAQELKDCLERVQKKIETGG